MSQRYEEAHRFADTIFPRELWDLGQADLSAITPTFCALAAELGAIVRMNTNIKHPHPSRGLVKRLGDALVRVELAAGNGEGGFPDRVEEFRYTLAVYRTPKPDLIHRFFPSRRDPTEWQVIEVYSPAEVREAVPALREALERTARAEFGPHDGPHTHEAPAPNKP